MLTTGSGLMDGIARHIAAVAPALNTINGCEVAVCTVHPDGELAQYLRARHIKVFSLNAGNGHDLRVLTGFWRVMRDFKPDIVHCHVLAILERIVAATCFRKVKYVSTVHGISDPVSHVSWRTRIERFLLRIFRLPMAATIYISDGVGRYVGHSETTGGTAYTVYNPMSFDFSPVRDFRLHNMLGLEVSVPIIGTACRLADPPKNTKQFTTVMCRVLQQNTRVHAAVMGDGEETLKAELRAIVESAGVAERFHWLGYRQDAPELVRDLSCFIMTSRWEGMPTGLLEAVAAKVPIAMMEGGGGLEDLAELHQTEGPIGLVAPPGDTETMSQDILTLIQNPKNAVDLAERAYHVAKKHFDIAPIARKIYNIYTTICTH